MKVRITGKVEQISRKEFYSADHIFDLPDDMMEASDDQIIEALGDQIFDEVEFEFEGDKESFDSVEYTFERE